jgi:hypothetical protein
MLSLTGQVPGQDPFRLVGTTIPCLYTVRIENCEHPEQKIEKVR